jgi:large subunit ribosomal protein L4
MHKKFDMELKLHKIGKKRAGKMQVSDSVFAAKYNEALIHQVLTAFMAGSRTGSKSLKSRSEVRGGGRKPWRQKGLGRARAGTIRSPIWRGGGVTFATKPKKYKQKVNKKMYRSAMCSILSELTRQDRLLLVDEIKLDRPKTKDFLENLQEMNLDEALIVTDEVAENLYLAARNIPRVDVIDTVDMNPYTLIVFEKVVMTKGAVEKIEAWLL